MRGAPAESRMEAAPPPPPLQASPPVTAAPARATDRAAMQSRTEAAPPPRRAARIRGSRPTTAPGPAVNMEGVRRTTPGPGRRTGTEQETRAGTSDRVAVRHDDAAAALTKAPPGAARDLQSRRDRPDRRARPRARGSASDPDSRTGIRRDTGVGAGGRIGARVTALSS